MPTGKIFVNYRRATDGLTATALYHRINDAFPEDSIFMDVEGGIRPGSDFEKTIEAALNETDIFLAIVGPQWLSSLLERSDEQKDSVAREIELALDMDLQVVLILVDGARPLGASEIEEIRPSLKSFALQECVELSRDRFEDDCTALLSAIQESISMRKAEREAKTKSDAERLRKIRKRKEQEISTASKNSIGKIASAADSYLGTDMRNGVPAEVKSDVLMSPDIDIWTKLDFIARSDQSNKKNTKSATSTRIVPAKCGKNSENFEITVRKEESDEDVWWFSETKKTPATNGPNSQDDSEKAQISGALRYEHYAGCPHCNRDNLIKCGCGRLFCKDYDSELSTCPWCGVEGKISGVIESVEAVGPSQDHEGGTLLPSFSRTEVIEIWKGQT